MGTKVSIWRSGDFPETIEQLVPGSRAISVSVCRRRSRGSARGDRVVIKTVKLTKTDTRKAFMGDAGIIQQCQDDHIVVLRGVKFDHDEASFIFRYAIGGNMKSALTDPSPKTRLSPDQRYSILHNILEGLKVVHSQNAVYLHLKLENVLLNEERTRARLADFSKLPERDGDGNIFVDSNLMRARQTAPEVLIGDVSPLADSWSFGVLLYEVATGKQFLPTAACQFITHGYVDLTDIPDGLHDLCKNCLAPKAERWNIDQISEGLKPRMLGVRGIPASVPDKRAEGRPGPKKRAAPKRRAVGPRPPKAGSDAHAQVPPGPSALVPENPRRSLDDILFAKLPRETTDCSIADVTPTSTLLDVPEVAPELSQSLYAIVRGNPHQTYC